MFSRELKLCTVFFFTFMPLVFADTPKFRILAPEFICPKDEEAAIEKPDNTIIMLQTAASSDFDIVWTVRWVPLVAPTQRFTLMLWKTVRALEAKLNRPQEEPYVYVIPNEELLKGVNYIFNITAVESDGSISSPKSFQIDNTKGDQKLDLIEGRGNLMHVILAGSQTTYVDSEYVLEALVTTCFPTQDFHFLWTVNSVENHEVAYVPLSNGSRLIIPPFTLKSGHDYDATCQVIKHSTGDRITKTGLLFTVSRRGLAVYLSADYLLVPVNQDFVIEAKVANYDYYDDPVEYNWECSKDGQDIKLQDSLQNNTLHFPSGLSDLGEYRVKLTVSVKDQTAKASTTVNVVGGSLPVIQITPLSEIQNEGSKIFLVANASNVAPTCTLTWYFESKNQLIISTDTNVTCDDCEHGEALSDTLTIFSLEENFLTELADFTNETEWRQVSGEMIAEAGRARFIAKCGCSITFECETKGMVYADKNFVINESPKPGKVKVAPATGIAMETLFRISTLPVTDQDTPITYTFYCGIAVDDVLILGSFVDHLAVETLLPYVEGGTKIWVEACDSKGACAEGDITTVNISKGDGVTVDLLLKVVEGHLLRCEFEHLLAVSGATIITFTNTNQQDHLSKFTDNLLSALPPDPQCLEQRPEKYTSFLSWLENHGVDTIALK